MADKEQKDTKVQKALSKLVSDEWFAGQTYRQFILLVKPEDRSKIAGEMLDVANDELDDHLRSLVDFGLSYGFSVPSTYNEMKKEVSKEDLKLFEDCKKGQDAEFYLDQAIEAEKRAIETYQKYVDDYEFAHELQDFKLIVRNNYYDEIDHLEKFKFMKDSLEAVKKFNQGE